MATMDILLIRAGDQTYALPLQRIQEIRGWSPVSPLPNTDIACLGVLNLRGQVLPVLDARRILGKPISEPRPQDVIVVVRIDDKPVGLLVDGVSDIVSIDPEAVSPTIAGDAWSSRLISGIATVNDQLVPLLELEQISGGKLPAVAQAA